MKKHLLLCLSLLPAASSCSNETSEDSNEAAALSFDVDWANPGGSAFLTEWGRASEGESQTIDADLRVWTTAEDAEIRLYLGRPTTASTPIEVGGDVLISDTHLLGTVPVSVEGSATFSGPFPIGGFQDGSIPERYLCGVTVIVAKAIRVFEFDSAEFRGGDELFLGASWFTQVAAPCATEE